MTKTITLPISKETCNTIKKYVGWFLWIGITTLAIYGLVYCWFDVGEWDSGRRLGDSRAWTGFISLIVSVGSPIAMINYLRVKGHWIKIQCNCDNEPKPRGNYIVRDKDGKIIEEGIEN